MFTVDYPAAWGVKNAEQQHSWGTDTTIVSPTDPNTVLRVDMTPQIGASTAREAAQPVISQLEKVRGYEEVDMSPETFKGNEALHWEFRVHEKGVTLHKEDLFFLAPNGDGVAVLTAAPDSRYEFLRSQFEDLRRSLSIGGAG